MTLDLASTAFLAQGATSGAPQIFEVEPDIARLMYSGIAKLSHDGPCMARSELVSIPTSDDSKIHGRLLVPDGDPKSAIIYYHGGGWVIGNIDDYETVGRHLAKRTNSIVLLVGYRRAPEFQFPTAPNDCFDALKWVDKNLENFAGSRVPIVVAGDSAGGNLAAVTAQRSLRENGPNISLQLLVYPVTDGSSLETESYNSPENQLMLSKASMEWFWDHYAPEKRDRNSTDASPLLSDTFDDLPPAIVVTAKYDPLRDEGEAYAEKLETAGVPVIAKRFENQMHGFFTMHNILPGAAEALEYVGEQIDRFFSSSTQVDAVIVGAGFAGLYQLLKLREMGLSTRTFDKAGGIGGTWYWNRYPGARCDIESMAYSYSFSKELEQEWTWSERYATQPEILRYLEHVADRFDLNKDISFNTQITRAIYDDEDQCWYVHTDKGEIVSSKYLIMATGCLSIPKDLDIPGTNDFEGDAYVTGHWPHDGVDFKGKRVAVIGTGSSGVQSIPLIAEDADYLAVYQRSPAYTMPAKNRPLTDEEISERKGNYEEFRATQRLTPNAIVNPPPPVESWHMVDQAERQKRYEAGWNSGQLNGVNFLFNDITLDQTVNDDVASFMHSKIQKAVKDPNTAAALMPRNYPVGTKRPCLDTGYYEAFNRENVDLIDLSQTPIERITSTGIQTSDNEKPYDIIVFATGFDAMTGALNAIDIRGSAGQSLKEKWAAGPRSYLGLSVSGFPNLFTITGPSSPSVFTNMVVSIEQHVEWISDCISNMRSNNHSTIEATFEAENEWAEHTHSLTDITLIRKSNAWYIGANVPGKARMMTYIYPGGAGAYRVICNMVAEQGYRGFDFR